ncbi:permease [Aureimonas sp. Leaf454]|uniref:EamA family transporter RarD n=1 Tax=Aureimonas sp. Leaf454 TaxID=1736381 RepID=UPI0006FA3CE7|nr:EamA family transporter RarD [Aureimonas sp. Leaf454]KQT54184.1 permease [Aureimonas sp. Leaf454]
MQRDPSATSRGLGFALGAYLIWGLIVPMYMKQLAHVPPLEIVAQRIVWALPFTLLVIWWRGLFGTVAAIFRSPRDLGVLAATATIISVNFGVYIYALTAGHAIDAALGYYINPLINVLLGALFLGERPTRAQSLALALATLAVAILTILAGGLPWIALVLSMSFGVYGLLRKVIPVGPIEGFFVEMLILIGPAGVLLLVLAAREPSHFTADMPTAILLVVSGPLVAIPMILFAAGAKLLDYSTIGMMQYLSPTLLFLTAVFVFGEPFSGWQLVAFALIWMAVAIYVASLLNERRARRRAERADLETVPPCA